jgi:hypothetical protein
MLTGRSDRIGLANRSGGLVPDKRARWPLEFPMTASDILAFVRTHSLAVQASVSMLGTPQAAVVGFIATDDFEMFFDTADSTRKVQNPSRVLGKSERRETRSRKT